LAFGVRQQSEQGVTPEMSERIIYIPSQRCTVEVYRLGKAYWVAVGKYWDEKIRTRGTTERKALKAWRGAISDKSRQK